jgi:hypothetical protein
MIGSGHNEHGTYLPLPTPFRQELADLLSSAVQHPNNLHLPDIHRVQKTQIAFAFVGVLHTPLLEVTGYWRNWAA